jgi:ribosome maturation factor RimP
MLDADRITQRLEPTINGLGFELWGIERGRSAQSQLLRVFIDKPDGISVDDCEAVSAQVADLIEVHELLKDSYTLEVSSPGMDRILFKPSQWPQYLGEGVQVRLRSPVAGKRRVTGKLLAADGDAATVEDETGPVRLPFSAIERARLVPDWSLAAAPKTPARHGKGQQKTDREKA